MNSSKQPDKQPDNSTNQNNNRNLGVFDILANELLFHLFNYLDVENLVTLLKLNISFNTFTKNYVVHERKPDSAQPQDFINALQRAGILMTASPYHGQHIKLFGPAVYFYITKDVTDDDSINYYFYKTVDVLYGSFKVKLKMIDAKLNGIIVASTLSHAIGEQFSVEPTSTDLLIYGHKLYRALIRSDTAFIGTSVRARPLLSLNFLCAQNDEGIYSATPHFFVYGVWEGQLKNYYDSGVNLAPLTYKTNDPVLNWDQRMMLNKIRLFNYCQTSKTITSHENNDTHSPPAKKNRTSTGLTE